MLCTLVVPNDERFIQDANGLANKYFEEKMTMLEQEKQQKIQVNKTVQLSNHDFKV